MSGQEPTEEKNLHLNNVLNPSYKPRSLKHKGAILTLFWNFSVLMALSTYLRSNKLDNIELPYQIILGFSTLAFPISGFLADVYIGRYKVVKCSMVFTWLATILYVIAQVLETQRVTGWLVLVAIGVGLFSFAAYQANALQHGIDQLVDASSSDISSYVSWFAWGFFISDTIGMFSQNAVCKTYTPLASLVAPILLTLCVCSDIFFNHWLIKEPVTVNPLRLIFDVVRYTIKNKYPRQRSAFTYWDDERYSRMDLAKNKFGGPFTTEQVEDVKTCFRIMVIVLVGSIYVGLVFVVGSTVTHKMVPHYHDQHYVQNCSLSISAFLRNSFERSFVHSTASLSMVIFIPIFEVLIYPLLWKWMPRLGIMRKFILGMFLHLFYVLSLMTLEIVGHHLTYKKYTDEGVQHNVTCMLKDKIADNGSLVLDFKWIALPKLFYGISEYCLLTSTIEFLCAQSPYSMKGLLGGMIYSLCSLSILVSTLLLLPFQFVFDKEQVGNLKFGCGIWYFLCVSILTALFIILGITITKRYFMRRRDENIHNEHMFAVDYYDRYIN